MKHVSINDSDIEFYRQNGYLVLPMLSPEECDYYYSLALDVADAPDFPAIMNIDRYDFLLAQAKLNIDGSVSLKDRVYKVQFLKTIAKQFELLANRFDVIRILERLNNREIVLLMTQMLYKHAGSRYAAQAWDPHQDNSYPLNENAQYITTNIFFRNSTKDNGTLYIYPGSHQYGLRKFDSKPSYREGEGKMPGNIPEMNDLGEPITVSFNSGDMLILNGNTVHGSFPNDSDRSRPLISCSYISSGEAFVPGVNASRRVYGKY